MASSATPTPIDDSSPPSTPRSPVVIWTGRNDALTTARCWRSWKAGVSKDRRSTAVEISITRVVA